MVYQNPSTVKPIFLIYNDPDIENKTGTRVAISRWIQEFFLRDANRDA
jgi:hypothetical protein